MHRLLGILAFLCASFAGLTAAEAKLDVRVDISDQRMEVLVDGVPTFEWKVSTAGRGYVTPTGSFKPIRLEKMWYSRKYDMSPMPYSVFFRGGYAIHGTNYVKSLGRPASHGCVRLHTANAATFYSMVRQVGPGNTRIHVVN